MKPDRDSDFDSSITELVQLLKKIMANHTSQSEWKKIQSVFQDKGINLNFNFFNFFPITGEELDELEEIYDQFMSDSDKKPEDLNTDLNSEDVDFLKKHGIRF